MSHTKRLSQSLTASWSFGQFVYPTTEESQSWLESWKVVFARDLIDSRVVAIDADASVEDACELLLTEDIPCLAVRARPLEARAGNPYHGLFDYADVNAFLTLAATRHTFLPDDSRGNQRLNDIVTAAKAGRVPVHLVSNLSDKNPIEILPHNATAISLLEVFARGAHRAIIQSSVNAEEFVGMVSDRRLLSWFDGYSRETPSFKGFLSTPIHSLWLPSVSLNAAVIAAESSASILDAMKLMSEGGVSSIAVVEENHGTLLSAVSVTDIGKFVAPSQSNQILTTPLHYFIARIKESDGSTDGADKYPVYSVLPSSLLSYTIEKLLATNAHRVFVTKESGAASPTMSPTLKPNLTGIVSIVDILSLFARIANVQNVDPAQMQRHRRASSASSQLSDRDSFLRSRSNSRTSVQRSPIAISSSPSGFSVLDSVRGSPSVPTVIEPLSLNRTASRKSISLKKDSLS
ncbi:hypothetical protein HYPSUDRAFT_42007 [Hypholoma sublateritium FD-334 SS-4]|uniref:CBS domain-containing protein n=1 Tax=Hypholoma sublateritium (strain FD-334 SS-4) TaxID=945553 RepID=A0A0D2L3L5_HYPSF|nr:hypothetical protein HYPSUDRAFT_42007 [Hypholoma sublateritium FD-334 SS-4]